MTERRRDRAARGAPLRDALDMITSDGCPLAATVARHQGRIVEILADDTASNDSADTVSASTDGEDDESEPSAECPS